MYRDFLEDLRGWKFAIQQIWSQLKSWEQSEWLEANCGYDGSKTELGVWNYGDVSAEAQAILAEMQLSFPRSGKWAQREQNRGVVVPLHTYDIEFKHLILELTNDLLAWWYHGQ